MIAIIVYGWNQQTAQNKNIKTSTPEAVTVRYDDEDDEMCEGLLLEDKPKIRHVDGGIELGSSKKDST